MDLQTIEQEALQELERSDLVSDIQALHAKFLGRKDGRLTQVLRGLAALPPEEKKKVGQAANTLRVLLEEKFLLKERSLQSRVLESKIQDERIDVSLPGVAQKRGASHPILQAIREISSIFSSLGFECVEERDMETDFHNFNALNIPADHPARDLHDRSEEH